MARITLDVVAQELSNQNWKVLSTEYKNLETEMVFECDEGHKVYSTWSKLRKHIECPVCKQNKFKVGTSVPTAKKSGVFRTLALDQATNICGYAIFDNRELVTYGIFQTDPLKDEATRIHQVKEWMVSIAENCSPDLIAIEGIQYEQMIGITTFQTLARLQGVLIEQCLESSINYKICPTNTWRAHNEVKGRSRTDKKKSMQLLIKQWYDVTASEDEADAIGIGKYAADTAVSSTITENWE